MSFDVDTSEQHERRIVRCRACRARIIFLETATGKAMPCDADSVEPEDTAYEHGRHISHFSTCNDPDRFRSPR